MTADRIPRPPGGPAAPLRAPVHRRVLGNGMTILVQESPAAPVAALTLGVGVGSCHEPPERSGVTTLLGRVLLKGTRARSALDVARIAEDAGGVIESAADQEYAEVAARGLARHWRALLRLIHEVATSPALAAEQVRREREVLLAQIRGLDDQPFQVANRLLSRALYGESGYGLPTSGRRETVAKLLPEHLAAHWAHAFVPERMVLAISGHVDSAAVVTEAEDLFGGLAQGGGASVAAGAAGRPLQSRDGERRPTQQSHVLMGFRAPPVGDPDHIPLKVANGVLGSGMSSRLFRILRDQAGLAYSVGSAYPTRRGTGRIVVHIGTAPINVVAAEAGMHDVVAGLRETLVSDDELERTKTYLTGSLALDLRTNARRSFYLAFYELMGVGADYLDRYPTLIEAVTATALRTAAARHLVEPSLVVVGPD